MRGFAARSCRPPYHWYRAAMSLNERLESLAHGRSIGASNFAGKGTAPVGRARRHRPVRHLRHGGQRARMAVERVARRTLDRRAARGTRRRISSTSSTRRRPGTARPETAFAACARSTATPTPRNCASRSRRSRSISRRSCRSRTMPTRCSRSSSNTRRRPWIRSVEPLRSTNPLWTRERITLATGYDDTRFAVQLFLPTGGTPPYQAVFYVPHAGFTMRPSSPSDFDPTDSAQPLDFILKSGRALVVVALDGTFERHWPPARRQSMSDADRYRTRLRHARQDLGRVDRLPRDARGHRYRAAGLVRRELGGAGDDADTGGRGAIPALVLDGGGVYLLDDSGTPSSSTTTCRGSPSRC